MGRLVCTYVEAEEAHPAFRTPLPDTSLTVHSGFGEGEHYTLETDASDLQRMVVEPGETTEVWYFSDPNVNGLSASDIETAESLSGGTVDVAWIKAQSEYGKQSDLPLAWDDGAGGSAIGRQVYNDRFDKDSSAVHSRWALFDRGGEYDFGWDFTEGESPLHPVYHGDFGTGDRPIMPVTNNVISQTAAADNILIQGIDFRELQKWTTGFSHLIYADCNFTTNDNGLAVTGDIQRQQYTLYACSFVDCYKKVPANGTSWGGNADDSSGHFAGYVDSHLRWRNFYDHNGWNDTYNQDGVTYNGGEFGVPPSFFSHNYYDSTSMTDVTNLEIVSQRPPFDHSQNRCGAADILVMRLEGNGGGNLLFGAIRFDLLSGTGAFVSNNDTITGQTSGRSYTKTGAAQSFFGEYHFAISQDLKNDSLFEPGETIEDDSNGVTGPWVDYETNLTKIYGNLSYFTHGIICGNQGLEVDVFQGVEGAAFNGIAGDCTVKNIIVCNAIDPNNAAETTSKSHLSAISATGISDGDISGPYKRDIIMFNWLAASDENAAGISTANKNDATLGGWADTEQSQDVGTSTVTEAADYLRGRSDRCLLAVSIYNYFAALAGQPTIGHTAGATATFSPDPDGGGYRTDSPDAWLIDGVRGDFPVDGDDCDLNDDLAYWFMTIRFSDMDFGAAGTGGWRMYGGFTSCDTTQGDGFLDIRGGSQFWFDGTSSATIDATLTRGRIGFKGTVSSGLSIAAYNESEIVVLGGASFTIASGQTITLNGDECLFGFDGTSGTATITNAGTLEFVADPTSGEFSEIREFRSGHFGLADLGSGVTGQPVETAVTSAFACGGTLRVNTTNAAAAVHTLVTADSISGGFAAIVDQDDTDISAEVTVGATTITWDHT